MSEEYRQTLKSYRRQGGIDKEGIARVVYHILEHNHTKSVAQIIEDFGLYLNMLSQHIKATFFHSAYIILVSLLCSGEKYSVGVISLI